jgi:hypothetical protein
MTLLEKQERKKKKNNKRIKKKIYPFWDKRKTMTNRGTRTICFGKIDYPPCYMPFDAIGK